MKNENLLLAAKCALADLEGIMPEFEPSGERKHPAWETIKNLKAAIAYEEKNPSVTVSKKVAKSIAEILDYVEPEEEEDYLIRQNEGEETSDHVYEHICIVRKELDII